MCGDMQEQASRRVLHNSDEHTMAVVQEYSIVWHLTSWPTLTININVNVQIRNSRMGSILAWVDSQTTKLDSNISISNWSDDQIRLEAKLNSIPIQFLNINIDTYNQYVNDHYFMVTSENTIEISLFSKMSIKILNNFMVPETSYLGNVQGEIHNWQMPI